MGIITLSTDYGTTDHYVGALKGVILSLCPDVRIVDVTHRIDCFHVARGAFVLRQIWNWYPAGTVHLIVVDPGVGSSRRILAGRYWGRYVVAPDNGLITLVHREFPVEAMHVVENPAWRLAEVARTFHGRDIMAPAAARLARGTPIREAGPIADRVELLAISHRAQRDGEVLRGSVLYVDSFGTLVTNITREQLATWLVNGEGGQVCVNSASIGPVRSHFSQVPPGEPIALLGSSGYLDIAVNQGRAVDRFGPAEKTVVEVSRGGSRPDAA